MVEASKGLHANCTHLVRWNDKSTGGRWYESIVSAKMSDGKSFYAKAHDGDEGCKTEAIAKTSSPVQGDTVVSYYKNSSCAYKGRIDGARAGEWFIEFDDGVKYWVPVHKVFKYSLC